MFPSDKARMGSSDRYFTSTEMFMEIAGAGSDIKTVLEDKDKGNRKWMRINDLYVGWLRYRGGNDPVAGGLELFIAALFYCMRYRDIEERDYEVRRTPLGNTYWDDDTSASEETMTEIHEMTSRWLNLYGSKKNGKSET